MLCAVILKSGSIPDSASYKLYDLSKLRDVPGGKKRKKKPKRKREGGYLSFFIGNEFRIMLGTSDMLNKC